MARIKTGQDLRSQKNRLKTQVIRIFCELLAKTGAETRIDTGFFEGYCRNEEKLVQGIDTVCGTSFVALNESRNEEKLVQGIDTFLLIIKLAPLRV